MNRRALLDILMPPGELPAAGTIVWARGHEYSGVMTGHFKHCTLEGCPSMRVRVRWTDKRFTWPCMRGLRYNTDGSWEIE